MENNLDLPFGFFYVTADFLDYNNLNQLISINDLVGIFLCKGGEIEVNIDSKRYHISSGDMFFFTSVLYVSIVNKSRDFCGLVLRSNYDFAFSLVNKIMDVRSMLQIKDNPCITLTPLQYHNIDLLIQSLVERIELEQNSSSNTFQKKVLGELTKSMGASLMYELINIYYTNHPMQACPQDRAGLIVQSFLISLYHHYDVKRDVAAYAQEQCLSPAYFSSLIKQRTGMNVSQWIAQMVMIDSRQMLQDTSKSIKEIAARLNFPNQSFFGKYFKQHSGVSPRDYRKQFHK